MRELFEALESFVGNVLGELNGGDDVVPIVVHHHTALVTNVGDGTSGEFHGPNLVSVHRSDATA